MSEHVKEGNKIQLSLNWPGKPEGNAKEVADFIGAKSFGLDGDLNYMYIYEPTQPYRVTNLKTYASTLHKNIIQDGQWVELWKEETETAEQLEQERLDKGLGVEAPRITLDHIQALMQRVDVVTEYSDNPIPHVTAKAFLDGSFFLGTAVSKAVDPANFDKELGFKYSTQDVLKAAEDKLWELEGYALYKNLQALDLYGHSENEQPFDVHPYILDVHYSDEPISNKVRCEIKLRSELTDVWEHTAKVVAFGEDKEEAYRNAVVNIIYYLKQRNAAPEQKNNEYI